MRSQRSKPSPLIKFEGSLDDSELQFLVASNGMKTIQIISCVAGYHITIVGICMSCSSFEARLENVDYDYSYNYKW